MLCRYRNKTYGRFKNSHGRLRSRRVAEKDFLIHPPNVEIPPFVFRKRARVFDARVCVRVRATRKSSRRSGDRWQGCKQKTVEERLRRVVVPVGCVRVIRHPRLCFNGRSHSFSAIRSTSFSLYLFSLPSKRSIDSVDANLIWVGDSIRDGRFEATDSNVSKRVPKQVLKQSTPQVRRRLPVENLSYHHFFSANHLRKHIERKRNTKRFF